MKDLLKKLDLKKISIVNKSARNAPVNHQHQPSMSSAQDISLRDEFDEEDLG